jgi:adenine-specific DNA-methyltransferase
MASLNWIGKEAVVNHDKEVSFKLLEKVPGASVGKESKNLIIHGDNLEALKALMPFYKGKVKCIYIDPPYNTGNEKWLYNDNVNSPKIRQWIGKVVGAEGEDLTRHDKWLCMMYPRIKLLRDLLRDDGIIFVSIDDNEHCNLKQIMDEIFGIENFISNIVWQKKYTQSNDAKYFSATHDFIVCYAKNEKNKDFKINLLARTEEQDARYKNPDNDPRGNWMTQPLHAKSGTDKTYTFTFKNGVTWKPPVGTFPRYSIETLKKADEEGTIWFGSNGTAVPRLKKYLLEMKEGVIPKTIWLYDEVGSNDEARSELKKVFSDNPFDTPKPTRLLKTIFKLGSNKNDLILDSFAGSGTTADAVMQLNKEEKGSTRKYILVEMEDEVAKKITAERIKRVIKRNEYKDGFEYCELAKPLFNEKGQINEKCSYGELASYIYFTETQTNINKKIIKSPFVGESHRTSYYLLYTGKNKNDLTRNALTKLKVKTPAVIYADRCLVDEENLRVKGIVFKQIPYEIKIY